MRNALKVGMNALYAAHRIDAKSDSFHGPLQKNNVKRGAIDNNSSARWVANEVISYESQRPRNAQSENAAATVEPNRAFFRSHHCNARCMKNFGEKIQGPPGAIGGSKNFDTFNQVADTMKNFIICFLEIERDLFESAPVDDLQPNASSQYEYLDHRQVRVIIHGNSHTSKNDQGVYNSTVTGVNENL